MKNINIAKIVDNLIIENQDEIVMYLEEKIEMIRENSRDLKLNPLMLMERFEIKLDKCDNLDERYKTYFRCDGDIEPCIFYNSKLDLKELRFYLMEEIIYYFMFKYVVDNFLDKRYLCCLEDRAFHVVAFDDISEILNTNNFINNTIRNVAFEAMIPSNIFVDFDIKNLSIRQLSTYYEVDDRIIEYYLKKNRKTKKRLLRR